MASRNRGKSKRSLRTLGREPPSHEERRAARHKIIEPQTDPIVAAILGAAGLDYRLEEMIRLRLRRNDDATWDLVVGENGPLATFSQKITFAYSMGLISETAKNLLDTVRQIRNVFAHSKKVIGFDNDLIKGALRKVPEPGAKRSRTAKYLKTVRKAAENEPQLSYALLCYTIDNDLIDVEARRINNRSRRLKFRRDQMRRRFTPGSLASVLYGDDPQKSPPINSLAELLKIHNADQTPLSLAAEALASPAKPEKEPDET